MQQPSSILRDTLPSSFNYSSAARSSLAGFFSFLERNNINGNEFNITFKGFRFEHPYFFVSKILIPPSTAVGLQLSSQEAHPGAHQNLGKSKEGFSLFSLLTNSGTAAVSVFDEDADGGGGAGSTNSSSSLGIMTNNGRSVMRNWFLNPTSDPLVLKQRHDAVEFLVEPQHREVLQALARAVHQFRDPLFMLRRIASGQHTTLQVT